jgi:hypothetical protein
MKSLRAVRRAVSCVIAVAASSGCGSPSAPNTASVSPSQTAASLARRAPGRSWMRPNVSNADLLYISDGNGEVTVYRYWRRTLVGLLTTFKQPLGLCVDAKGDVFVTDYGAQSVIGYAHGATKPFRTISDAPYSPYDCSVDPVTGNLAVANASGGSSGEGNIAIYPHATGKPSYYTDSKLFAFQSCVYDASGDLLVTNGNLRQGNAASFAWLPEGGTKLIDINVPGPQPSYNWQYVQGLQWDGKYFVLEDYATLYRIAFLKGQAYYVGATYLSVTNPTTYWIYNNNSKLQGTQVVGGYHSGSYSGVEYYKYPAGGDAIYYISHAIDKPYGLTVSLRRASLARSFRSDR